MTRALPFVLAATLAGCGGPLPQEERPAQLSFALAEGVPASLAALEVGALEGGDCAPFFSARDSLTCPSPVETATALLGVRERADGELKSRLVFPADLLDAEGRATLAFHVPVGKELRLLVQALTAERRLLGSLCFTVNTEAAVPPRALELVLLAPEAVCQPILP